MNKKVVLIIGAVLLVCCVGIVAVAGLGGLAALGATQPAAQAGENFMSALKAGDYSKAFDLCDPALQSELKDVQGLETMITNGNVQPNSWKFTSRNVDNSSAKLEGSATFTGDRAGTVSLELNKTGNDWKVIGFHLKGN